MPAAIKYVPPTDENRTSWSSAEELEINELVLNYEVAKRYYEGNQDRQLQKSQPDYNEDGDPDELQAVADDDNTVVNMVQMVADRTASFLFPAVPELITDPASIEETPEELYLREALEANGGLFLLVKWALQGWLAGHTYLRVRQGSPYPKVTLMPPGSVKTFWNMEDPDQVLWYSCTYPVGMDRYVQDFIWDEKRRIWVIDTYKQTYTASTGEKIFAEAGAFQNIPSGRLSTEVTKVSRAIHGSSIPPILETPHLPHPDLRTGRSEFSQKALQDVINKLVSVRNSIARQNNEPVDLIMGTDAEDVDLSGNVITVPNAQARPYRFEMKGDMAGLTTSIDKMVETFLAISRVVLLKGDVKDLQRVTNASVRTLYLDALSKNSILMSSYGRTLKALGKLMLYMGYATKQVQTNPDTLKVDIKFVNPLPEDKLEIATINQIATSGGWMSAQTAATDLGKNWAFEKQAMALEPKPEPKETGGLTSNEKPV